MNHRGDIHDSHRTRSTRTPIQTACKLVLKGVLFFPETLPFTETNMPGATFRLNAASSKYI
jgi:hypothetical protein